MPKSHAGSKKAEKYAEFMKNLSPKEKLSYADYTRIRLKSGLIITHYIKSWSIWSLCCCTCFKENKVDKMYEKSEAQIEKEMDIIRLIKNIRNIKLILQEKLPMSKQEEYKLNYKGPNVLDLDESDEPEEQKV